jgi:hypothetical protein
MRGGREEVRPIDASRVEIVGASFLFQSILSVTILFLSFSLFSSLSRGSNRKHDVISGALWLCFTLTSSSSSFSLR